MSPEPIVRLYDDVGHRSRTLAISMSTEFFEAVAERYGRVVVERLADRVVEELLASAAVQARIAAIRAELPVRIEQAVAAAITAALVKPLEPTP